MAEPGTHRPTPPTNERRTEGFGWHYLGNEGHEINPPLQSASKETMVSSRLLLRYFEIAQGKLQNQDDDELVSSEAKTTMAALRSRIVGAQLASLDDAVSEWQGIDSSISRESVQGVLRQIGLGDYSSVSFGNNVDHYSSMASSSTTASSSTGLRSRSSRGDGDQLQSNERGVAKETDKGQEQQQLLLAEAVETTNELARRAFSRSVLIAEWRQGSNAQTQLPQSGREFNNGNGNGSIIIDETTVLEYCGLMMSAVRLPQVQLYLQNGTANFLPDQNNNPSEGEGLGSAEDRLIHIQKLYWRALDWEPKHAMDQLKCLLSGECTESGNDLGHLMNNANVMETLTKYASVMTVAATNAAMANIGDGNDPKNDDGTTRVVSVSYSEKIITGSDIASHSNFAPTSNTIDEHAQWQQRRELDTARATSVLQNKLWEDFKSLSSLEQAKTVERAQIAHRDFLEKVANTPPGGDRVLLMQSIDGEVQKLLVIYKLWCSHNGEL